MTEKTKFEELYSIDIRDKVEKKKSGKVELSYLSWAYAVREMERAYPDWEYRILEFNGLPYQFDPNTGYMVWTEIKAGGKIRSMWLPVMDGSNKAMKDKVHEYFVKSWNDAPPTRKTIEAASMFDINKTIMRCLVKNIAMFGIGLYLYAGEDLPDNEQPKEPTSHQKLGNCVDDEEMQQLKQQKKEADEVERKAKAKSYCAQIEAEIEGCGYQSEIEAIFEREAKNLKSLQSRHPELFKKLFEHSVKCSVPDSEENSGALQGVAIANLKQILK